MFLRSDERALYLRKGGIGLVAVKTGQTVLIAVFDAANNGHGVVAKIVLDLADYLESVGY